MEESHDAEGDHHNTGTCCHPKIAEFRLCCKHFFGQNPGTTCQMTPIKVQSQFFQEKNSQGRREGGGKTCIRPDHAKDAAVARALNKAEVCANGQVSNGAK